MADVVVGLMTFFDDLAYTVSFVDFRSLPAQVADKGGVLRIARTGGGSDRDGDYPIVSIQSYATETQTDPRAAHNLDAAVWGRFLEVLNGERTGWVAPTFAFESPDKTSGPVDLPSPDPQFAIVESIYRLTIRQ